MILKIVVVGLYLYLGLLVYQISKHDWVELTKNPLKIRVFDIKKMRGNGSR